jgi:hypothetical protein
VLKQEMREHARIARRLGLSVISDEHALGVRRQCVFYANQFVIQEPGRYFSASDRVALWYLHGLSRDRDPSLAACFEGFRRHHRRLARVQVSNRAMRDLVLDAGAAPETVFLIPIGVRTEWFPVQTSGSRRRARSRLGVPQSAVVLGSFQKDGVGWGDGLEPKWIKGPDVFLAVCRKLHARVPDLFVLVSGPARGYVRRGLRESGIPFRHAYPPRRWTPMWSRRARRAARRRSWRRCRAASRS